MARRLLHLVVIYALLVLSGCNGGRELTKTPLTSLPLPQGVILRDTTYVVYFPDTLSMAERKDSPALVRGGWRKGFRTIPVEVKVFNNQLTITPRSNPWPKIQWSVSSSSPISGSRSKEAAQFQAAAASSSGCSSDMDGDGVSNEVDNCPNSFNPGQEDRDSDGTGDVCDPEPDAKGPPIIWIETYNANGTCVFAAVQI